MKKIIKNWLFVISLFLMQIESLFSAVEAYYPREISSPMMVYKPLAIEFARKTVQIKVQDDLEEVQSIPRSLTGTKDDSFLPLSKAVIAQKYKQRSSTLEDYKKDVTEIGNDIPVAIKVDSIDDNFAESGLIEYSGLTQIDAKPITVAGVINGNAETGPESYNAQGEVTRKDFSDSQGNHHQILYDFGIETETITDKNGHKIEQIIKQADNNFITRSYKYDNVSGKNLLQSIKTKLADGSSVFKRFYSGDMIGAQVRNKAGQLEGVTYRDDHNRINTTIISPNGSINRSRRDSIEGDYYTTPSR